MTVQELRERMPQVEFVMWSRFHARRVQAEQLAQRMGHG